MDKQISLKPQDLVVILKIIVMEDVKFTFASLADALFLTASQVHASLHRAELARLVSKPRVGGAEVIRPALLEFVLHGARYAFPAIVGRPTRGLPTSHASPAMRAYFTDADDPPVWPFPDGPERGMSVQPLYPAVPRVAEIDPELYGVLACFDALRMGAARERKFAFEYLSKRLS
jgi:hypothetical protein